MWCLSIVNLGLQVRHPSFIIDPRNPLCTYCKKTINKDNLPRHEGHGGLTSPHYCTFIMKSPLWASIDSTHLTLFHSFIFHVMGTHFKMIDYLHHDITSTWLIVASSETHLLLIPPFFYISTVRRINQKCLHLSTQTGGRQRGIVCTGLHYHKKCNQNGDVPTLQLHGAWLSWTARGGAE